MNEATPGPYYQHGSNITSDTPQDVGRRASGFNTPEYGGRYLIAESVLHKPTARLLSAAPDLLKALKNILTANAQNDPGALSANVEQAAINAIAKAEALSTTELTKITTAKKEGFLFFLGTSFLVLFAAIGFVATIIAFLFFLIT